MLIPSLYFNIRLNVVNARILNEFEILEPTGYESKDVDIKQTRAWDDSVVKGDYSFKGLECDLQNSHWWLTSTCNYLQRIQHPLLRLCGLRWHIPTQADKHVHILRIKINLLKQTCMTFP